MLRLLTGQIEQCAADKKEIRTICPHLWIHYVLSGTGYYNGEPMRRGQAFIVYPGDTCVYRPEPSDPWKYLWVRLWGEDRERLLETFGFPRASGSFYYSYAERLEEICTPLLGNDPTRAQPELGENIPFAEALCKLLLSMHGDRADHRTADTPERWVRQAKAYIQSNYHKPIRVETIARLLHIDRKYLRNLFVRYTGTSTKDYLTRVRMTRAKELLRSTEESIGMIAASVGYEDALAFSKVFKQHTGVSPNAYRKQG